MSGNLARLLKAAGQPGPTAKPILEINPKHPVVQRLRNEETKFDDDVNFLFTSQLLNQDFYLANKQKFKVITVFQATATSGGLPAWMLAMIFWKTWV